VNETSISAADDPAAQSELAQKRDRTYEPGTPSNRLGGWATITIGVSLVGWFVLQIADRGGEPDDARVSMAFLRDNPRAYVVAGLLLWVTALALTISLTVVSDVMAPRVASIQRRSATTVGYFSAAFFMLYGVLLVSTPGTLQFMSDLDSSWGEAAYLAVQIVGSQGMATGGLLAFSVWAIWVGVVNARAKVLSRAVTVVSVFPALLILMGILGPLEVAPDALYFLYVLAFLGLLPWCLTLGVSLIRIQPRNITE
jgi:hypothetical protein